MPTASRQFQVFVKPGGASCNLDCRYCYYLKTESLYPAGSAARMDAELLERYISQHIAASPDETVTFAWHGGEPTALGLDYFRLIVEIQRRLRPAGRRVVNGIQTNGLLLDDEWCRFFAGEGFLVGLSLDGPAEMHDCYRVTRGQQPTHAQVERAFERLQRHRVSSDLLCVVHRENARAPARVYRYFRSLGARSLTFLPLVERDEQAVTGVSGRTVSADAYGRFLCTVFDEWAGRDEGRIAVQLFDEATRPARGLDHSLCIFRETCGDMPVVERNGDFYCCDHYVDPAHRLGNIGITQLATLIDSPEQRAFGDAKRDTLPGCCRTCDVLPMCNGGCPKDRFIQAPDGDSGLNYLCAGLKRFFAHVQPYARKLAAEQPVRRTLDDVLRAGEREGRTRPVLTGRNAPCPCGSGLKYKRCCLGRTR